MARTHHLGETRSIGSLFACAAAALLLCASAVAQNTSPGATSTPAQNPSMTAPPAVTPPADAPVPAAPPEPSQMPNVPGTPIDRIVAIVNDQLILDSDVNEEMRFEDFDPYRNPTRAATRDDIIERLINRDLILQQLKLQPEDAPTNAAVNKQIEQLRKNIPACNEFHCETTQGWDRFLAEHGFTEASFFARWKERMTVLNFIEERFQMGINITRPQIQAYYQQKLLPEYKRRNAPAPKLASIAAEIREILVQQQISSLLEDWLQSLRAQGSVVVLHPGQEAP